MVNSEFDPMQVLHRNMDLFERTDSDEYSIAARRRGVLTIWPTTTVGLICTLSIHFKFGDKHTCINTWCRCR
jgi:hypothetical protein